MDNQNDININHPRYSESALKEKEHLRELNQQPWWPRLRGYTKLSGPAFLEAALTLGAGSFASSVTLGALYGYKMLWAPFYSYLVGLFILALATRFVTASEIPIIEAQNKYHGKFVGSFATGFAACIIASIIYSFGQYALGVDAITSLFALGGINMSKKVGALIIFLISAPLTLLYGKGEGTKYVTKVESIMKALIFVMLIMFGAVLFVTGINVPEMLRGLFIPTIPSGIDGIIMLIASLTAVLGVMDWMLFYNGMYSRGYSEEHEKLGRFDAVFGGLIPVTLILSLISIAFAEAFAGNPGIPTSSNELADALVSIIPSVWIQIGFYIGILAMSLTSIIGLAIVSATSFCQSMELEQDADKWYWNVLILLPQIGLFGSFFGQPVAVVITVAAMQSLLNWLSGMSWYLLGNDVRFLGDKVIQSRIFNVGVLLTITLLNIVFVTFVLSKIGVWPA